MNSVESIHGGLSYGAATKTSGVVRIVKDLT